MVSKPFFPLKNPTMISITKFSENIIKDLVLREKNFEHMYGCPSCGYEGMLTAMVTMIET
ncbi:hypothetical protein EDD71_11524 [Fonticella tunisiensis]|uniref:Uncharacterized protein n=1 Tax=Fonticella tunisiensis TaxID=1096341 RepID=A0A4R7KAT5_9CLOT|nr:hypothetical protein EDD71_11524 [Fonticella tunisiensis]